MPANPEYKLVFVQDGGKTTIDFSKDNPSPYVFTQRELVIPVDELGRLRGRYNLAVMQYEEPILVGPQAPTQPAPRRDYSDPKTWQNLVPYGNSSAIKGDLANPHIFHGLEYFGVDQMVSLQGQSTRRAYRARTDILAKEANGIQVTLFETTFNPMSALAGQKPPAITRSGRLYARRI